MKSIEDLFHALMQEVYFTEKQMLKSFGAMADANHDAALCRVLSTLRIETQGQIGRLERTFETIGRRPRGRHSDLVLGIAAEVDAAIRSPHAGQMRDAGLIAAAQVAAHHAVARYAALAGLAEPAGECEASRLLRRSLDEKRSAVLLLDRVMAAQTSHPAQAA